MGSRCKMLTSSFLFILIASSSAQSTTGPLCSRIQPSPSNVAVCSDSSDELASGRSVQGSRSRSNDGGIPPWMNLTLARQGQAFGQKNFVSVGLGGAGFGLMSVLSIPDIQDVLIFSNNSASIATSLKRYVATGAQLTVWINDVLSADLNNNAFLTSISNVRSLHVNMAQKATNHGSPLNNPAALAGSQTDNQLWTAFSADLKESNIPQDQRVFAANYNAQSGTAVPINQFALTMTLFGFIGYTVMDPASLYIYDATEEELKGFIHLWAIIGYAIGIDDKYNICLQPDVASTKEFFQEIQAKYYNPSIFNVQQGSKILIEALIGGFQNYAPQLGLGFRVVLLRYLRDMVKIPVPHMTAILTPLEQTGESAIDNVFVPSTRVPGFQQGAGPGTQAAVDGAILVFFGPYVTNMDKATHVFYNGSTLPILSGVGAQLPIIG